MRATLFVLVGLLLVSSVAAIGVSPPKATITFEPGYSDSVDILLRNTVDKDVDTVVKISGPLRQYIEAETPSIRARGSDKSTISWNLPEDIPPGTNRHQILFTEKYFDEQEGSVNVRTGVAFQLDIWKPYPGQYVELDVRPTHVPAGSDTQVEVRMHSRGDQAVSGELRIDVLDAKQRLLDTVIQQDIAIDADSSRTRFAQLKTASFVPGKYDVRVRYDYAGDIAEKTATLILGEETILLNNLTRDFYRDVTVNRFEVEVESMWNEPLRGVSASMKLGANTGKSPSITLAPFEQKTLTAYWDTDMNLEEGTYTALVTGELLDGEPVERSFEVQVHNESPRAPEEQSPEPVVWVGLADVVFVLVVLVTILYFILKTNREHKKRA